MILQTAMNPKLAEAVYRSVLNGATATMTVTSASVGLGVGMPVILATASASANGYYAQSPITATTVGPNANNLFIGVLDHSLGASTAYIKGEEVGVVQCYGYCSANLATDTDTFAAGFVLVPDIGQFVTAVGPVTAAATATAAHGEAAGIGGLAYLVGTVASSSAAAGVQSVGVFLRCL